MHPENIPNLLAIVRHLSWAEELNWGLHMTFDWEERIPFHSYVQPGTTSTRFPGHIPSMSQFSTLPVELQLHILSFCSASTLFQLMRVSSALRTEASKLFWANPEAYFLVDEYWLLDGGHPGHTGCDLSILSHVQNVEIQYRRYDEAICTIGDNGVMEARQEPITTFWTSFKKRFPNAKRVVINQNWRLPAGLHGTEPVPPALKILLQYCPPEVQAFAFILEEASPTMDADTSDPSGESRQRSYYQRSAGDIWTRVGTGWGHKTILMPMKHFHGPVGRYMSLDHERERVWMQLHGLWPLSLEALDRHHFNNEEHKPFSCPYSNCDGYFQKAGEWTVHAVKSHSQEWNLGEQFCTLPDDLRVAFEEREKILKAKQKELRAQLVKMQDAWNEEGGEKQRQMEREWMEQLGETARESKLWKVFSEQMIPSRYR